MNRFWTIMVIALVALNLIDTTWSRVVGAGLLTWFTVEELRTGFNDVPGDSFSDYVWQLLLGRVALLPLVAGGAVWLVWQFVRISGTWFDAPASVVDAVGWDVGLGTLAAGTALTLIMHFVWRGKLG